MAFPADRARASSNQPRTTIDMLRDLFTPSKQLLGESTGADVVPFTPALTAKQLSQKSQSKREQDYRAPVGTETPPDPKLLAARDLAKQTGTLREVTPEVSAEKMLQQQGFWLMKPGVNPQTNNMRQDIFVPEGSRKQHPYNFEIETNPQTGNTLLRTNVEDKGRSLAVDIPFASRQEALQGVGQLFENGPPKFLDMFKYAYQQQQALGVKLGKEVLDLPAAAGATAGAAILGSTQDSQATPLAKGDNERATAREDALGRMGRLMGNGDSIGQGMILDGQRLSGNISDQVPRRDMPPPNPFSSGIPDNSSNTSDIQIRSGQMLDPYRLSPSDLRKYLEENK